MVNHVVYQERGSGCRGVWFIPEGARETPRLFRECGVRECIPNGIKEILGTEISEFENWADL